MNNASTEFNKQLALDVLVSGLTEITKEYARSFNTYDLDKVIIPEGITSIESNLFSHSIKLKRLQLPKGLTSIGHQAFWNCPRLKKVTIPDSVTSIGSSAFASCRALSSITIPDRVTYIGQFAFFRCSSITNLTIPKRTNIGFNAFSGCNARIRRDVLCETVIEK